jgi:hypothetical protein
MKTNDYTPAKKYFSAVVHTIIHSHSVQEKQYKKLVLQHRRNDGPGGGRKMNDYRTCMDLISIFLLIRYIFNDSYSYKQCSRRSSSFTFGAPTPNYGTLFLRKQKSHPAILIILT